MRSILKIIFTLTIWVFFQSPLNAQMQSGSISYTDSSKAVIHHPLDSLSKAYYNQGFIAGFSVAIIKAKDTLLLKSYGKADIGMNVPALKDTKYRLIGPAGTILTILLMQQVEEGVVALDDDITHLLPEFPWQGRSVALRQLLNSTSGLPDYHYLGDSFIKEIAVPKSYEDVTSLFAGLPFTHEPGKRFRWTISGMHLAGIILERITGKTYEELLKERIIDPLNLENTTYCGEQDIVSNLSTGYISTSGNIQLARPESPSMYPFHVTVCSSAGDIYKIFHAFLNEQLLSPKGIAEIIPEGSNKRGMGVFMSNFEGKRSILSLGALYIGYKSFVQIIPEEDTYIIVLKNTLGGKRGWPFCQNLSRAALELDLEPMEPQVFKELKDLPVNPDLNYSGTYKTTFLEKGGTRMHYVRTYKIYEKNDKLMIQALGDVPERLLKQGENEFARPSRPNWPVTFSIIDDKVTGIKIKEDDGTGVGGRINESE